MGRTSNRHIPRAAYRTLGAIQILTVAAYLFVLVLPADAAGIPTRARTVDRTLDTVRAAERFNSAAHTTGTSVQWARLARVSGTLSDREIARLSRLSKVQGSSRVGAELDNLRLSNSLREDAYLRILVHRRTVLRDEALEMHQRLRGVEGFPAR